MNKVTMYRLRISKRCKDGRYTHQYSKEYRSVAELFANKQFAQYVQDHIAGNIYISLHVEARTVVVSATEEKGGAQ